MEIIYSQSKSHETLPYSSKLEKYFNVNNSIIKEIKDINGTIILNFVSDTLIVKLRLLAKLTVLSSYTGNPFKLSLNINEDLFFTDKKELESEDIILVKDSIDLDYYIYSFLITSLPIDLHKKGEVLSSGEGYRVLKESDLKKEKKNSSNNPFTKLDDINLD